MTSRIEALDSQFQTQVLETPFAESPNILPRSGNHQEILFNRSVSHHKPAGGGEPMRLKDELVGEEGGNWIDFITGKNKTLNPDYYNLLIKTKPEKLVDRLLPYIDGSSKRIVGVDYVGDLVRLWIENRNDNHKEKDISNFGVTLASSPPHFTDGNSIQSSDGPISEVIGKDTRIRETLEEIFTTEELLTMLGESIHKSVIDQAIDLSTEPQTSSESTARRRFLAAAAAKVTKLKTPDYLISKEKRQSFQDLFDILEHIASESEKIHMAEIAVNSQVYSKLSDIPLEILIYGLAADPNRSETPFTVGREFKRKLQRPSQDTLETLFVKIRRELPLEKRKNANPNMWRFLTPEKKEFFNPLKDRLSTAATNPKSEIEDYDPGVFLVMTKGIYDILRKEGVKSRKLFRSEDDATDLAFHLLILADLVDEKQDKSWIPFKTAAANIIKFLNKLYPDLYQERKIVTNKIFFHPETWSDERVYGFRYSEKEVYDGFAKKLRKNKTG